MSDYDKALPYHLRELKLYEMGMGKRSKEVADTLVSEEACAECAACMSQCDAHLQLLMPHSHVLLQMILGVVYVSMASASEDDDAKRAFRRAWMIRDKLYGRDAEGTQEAEQWLKDVMENDGEWTRMGWTDGWMDTMLAVMCACRLI